MPVAQASGFYGKLPCRGDFMQRRVGQEFVEVWDAWLQECLHASRQQLGERWLDAYLTSPIWRFALSPGVCGGQGYRGVLMPSVDRVGRYFPLVILSPIAGSSLAEAACGAGRAWFDAAESLALGALEASDLDLDAFDGQVAALESLGGAAELGRSADLIELMRRSAFASGASQWHVPMLGDTPQGALNALASLELEKAMRPCTLWWTQGSDSIEPAWLSSRGLPAPATFAALLSGEWRGSGWNSIELAHGPAHGTEVEGDAPERSAAAAPAAAPAGTAVPSADFEISAAHPMPRRDPTARAEPRFVVRPEVGLWGVVYSADGGPALASVERVADMAHDLAPQSTLTALVEETRRSLQRVLNFSGVPAATAIGATSTPPGVEIGAVFLLARGAECALVWIGAMQALSVRGGAPMALLTEESRAPIPAVRYERLRPGDRWVLGSAAALRAMDEAGARGFATALGEPGEGLPADRAFGSLLTLSSGSGGTPGDTPPVMLLTVRAGAPG